MVPMSRLPLVSVRLMTYNHADYIEQAIKSILSQKVTFLVEIVIGDDLSTDDTLDRINKFKGSDNFILRILNRHGDTEYALKRRTIGRLYNHIDILRHCSGKYIAMLDGDDYWTDDLKLQKQVDFLEENNQYTCCFHNTVKGTTFDEGILQSFAESREVCLKDAYFHTIGHISSMLFRVDCGIPEEALKVAPVADWTMKLHLLKDSRGYYMNDVMSFYRVHPKAMYAATGGFDQVALSLSAYDILPKFFIDDSVSPRDIKLAFSKMSDKMVLLAMSRRNLSDLITGIRWSLKLMPIRNLVRLILHFSRIKRIEYVQ